MAVMRIMVSFQRAEGQVGDRARSGKKGKRRKGARMKRIKRKWMKVRRQGRKEVKGKQEQWTVECRYWVGLGQGKVRSIVWGDITPSLKPIHPTHPVHPRTPFFSFFLSFRVWHTMECNSPLFFFFVSFEVMSVGGALPSFLGVCLCFDFLWLKCNDSFLGQIEII